MSVCPSVVIVCRPVKVEPGGSVRSTEDPSGSVNVSTFEIDADGVEDTTLDVIGIIGSTVNVEPDVVSVSSPVTEALAGIVTVTIGPLGSVSVSTIKDADPLGSVDVRELEPVEGDTVFEVDGPTGPLELVAVLETGVPVETDDSGEVEEPILEAADEKTVEVVGSELLQVVVTFVQDDELPGGTYWRTPGTTGLEKEVPARAARLDRPIICFNAMSASALQWPRRTMANTACSRLAIL